MIAVKHTPVNNALWPFEDLCKYFDIKDRRKYVYGLILGNITPPNADQSNVYIYSRWSILNGTEKNPSGFLGYIVAQGYTDPPNLTGVNGSEYLELMEDLDGNCIAGAVFAEKLQSVTKSADGTFYCGSEKLDDLYGTYYKPEKLAIGTEFNVLPLYQQKPKNWEALKKVAYEVSPLTWAQLADYAAKKQGVETATFGDVMNSISSWGEAMMLGTGWGN